MEEVRAFKEDLSGNFVTSRQIAQGDIVIAVPPLVTGPGRGKPAVCLGCCKRPDEKSGGSLTACPGCGWPLCTQNCQQFHSPDECQMLKGETCDPSLLSDANSESNVLDFILPLRVIQLIRSKKHADDLKGALASLDKAAIMATCREKMEKSDRSVRERLQKLKCTNSEIEEAVSLIERYNVALEFGCRGLYVPTFKICDSCAPNTYCIGLASGWVVYRAARQLAPGEVITTSRVPIDKCNYFRRQLLAEWGIKCECERCMDGTELGTGYGSLKCGCGAGLLAPENPGDKSSAWRCNSCSATKPQKDCAGILERLNKSLNDDINDNKKWNPEYFEKLLAERPEEWKCLADTNQLILDIRKQLSYIYQYHPKYYFAKSSWLRLKVDHCLIWLEVLDKLVPGWNYEKILMIFELGNARVSLIQAMKEDGEDVAKINELCYLVHESIEDPIRMLIEEEDQSMCDAMKQQKMIALEAREEQKTRVYINRWAEEEDEGW